MKKAKSVYYLTSFSSSWLNPSEFWKVINSTKSNVSSLPTHVNSRNIILTWDKEICAAFNKHFVAAVHIFKNQCMGSASSANISIMMIGSIHIVNCPSVCSPSPPPPPTDYWSSSSYWLTESRLQGLYEPFSFLVLGSIITENVT